jgi:2,4-dienoyl-CoA reductase-like NADH-dependent reductase (Old Yellow Enzyme family)
MARPGISATQLLEDGEEVVPKANSQQEQVLADAFARGAVAAKEAGFDGVEFHGAHGYLLDSFLRAGRVDFLCDLVRETRNQVGPELVLALRFSQWTVRDHSARQFDSPQQLERALLPLQEAGIDMFHASTRRFWLPEFAASDLNLAGWTRKITEAPTITVGNIGLATSQFCGDGPESADELQRRFDRGEFDMAAIGRPLISDAEWCDKIHAGRTDAIVDYTPDANEIYP